MFSRWHSRRRLKRMKRVVEIEEILQVLHGKRQTIQKGLSSCPTPSSQDTLDYLKERERELFDELCKLQTAILR